MGLSHSPQIVTNNQEVFFDAITKEIEPNKSLQLAASNYSKLIEQLNG